MINKLLSQQISVAVITIGQDKHVIVSSCQIRTNTFQTQSAWQGVLWLSLFKWQLEEGNQGENEMELAKGIHQNWDNSGQIKKMNSTRVTNYIQDPKS